jgi:hypothetical protein
VERDCAEGLSFLGPAGSRRYQGESVEAGWVEEGFWWGVLFLEAAGSRRYQDRPPRLAA